MFTFSLIRHLVFIAIVHVYFQIAHWTQFNHTELNILDALEKLNIIVDESDPDVDVPNSVHAYQTAERIRQAHPDKPWLQLTGLIHDLGKLMATYGESQVSEA